MENLQQKLDAAGGRPSGFDYMRVTLSMMVIILHSFSVTAGREADYAQWDSPVGPLWIAVLPTFFALSGFLVAGSLFRCRSLFSFMGLRLIRIYPALTAEVLLSAFIIGPILTSVTLATYFSDPSFFQYMWNVIGHIHYRLPGMFESNPLPRTVNMQLWTVPYELLCYIVLCFAALAGLRKYRFLAPAAVVLIAASHLTFRLLKHGHYVVMGGGLPGAALVMAFMTGISLYLYRDRIRFSAGLFAVAALAVYISFSRMPLGEYVGVIAAGYVTVYLGLCNPKRVKLIKGADYSYGMYLYGFVIQQTVVSLFPGQSWWMNAISSILVAGVFAAFSWHLIEKPALKAKAPLMRAEDFYLKLRAKVWGGQLAAGLPSGDGKIGVS